MTQDGKIMNFVLVHGACHGGWCWKPVEKLLRSQGHEVYSPTLTGMGDRAHLLTPDITVQTHIDDISNLIQKESLNEVVLVGHSYAGLAVAGATEFVAQHIKQLVFLDAYIPQNGKTGFEIISEPYITEWTQAANQYGDGWLNHADERSLDLWGIEDPHLRKMMLPKLTDFSINFLKAPITLSEAFDHVEKTFIHCSEKTYCYDLMFPFYQYAKDNHWPTFVIETGHDPMLTKPQELVEILLSS